MRRPHPLRRLLIALLTLAGASVGPAAAQAPASYSAVTVDVAALRAKGLGPLADIIRGDLTEALRRAFADRTGTGPRLVVRITGLSMNAYAGPEGRTGQGFGGGMNNDYLEGEALVVDGRGGILLRHPQLSVSPASSGGAWYDPASERRRVGALALHYAQWLRRAL